MEIRESGENYLEAILILSREQSMVRSVDLAAFLGVTKPSVSRAMTLLRGGGYVEMAPDGALTLTDAGLEVADRMYERHQLLTAFLTSLGVCPEQAAEDACRMEHVISAESFEKLRAFAERQMGDQWK
jgi:DtxR family Mn-dependent transcriptional regulator